MVREAEKSNIYLFDGFRLDPRKRLVYDPDGKAIALKAKAFETLLFLVQNPGRTIGRDELLRAIWPDTVVEENNLTQHISSLRRMFGEKPDDHRFIATVPGYGYQFVAHVHEDDGPTAHASPAKTNLGSRRWLIVLAMGVAVSLLIAVFFYRNQSAPAENRSIRSIAVLPFKPLDEQNRNVSLEMGMTQDLIARLADTEDLKVLPFSAVRRFDSPRQDAVEAGRELGVDTVLDVSVQFLPDRMRFRVFLLKVEDSKQLWYRPFDGEETDLDMQDSISEQVATALKVRLGEHATKRYTENVPAFRLYTTGRFYLSKLKPEDTKHALEDFQEAIDLDPTYALAYTGISDVYRSSILSGELSPAEMAPKAMAAADKAAAIEPDLPEAQTNLGFNYFWYKRDWAASETAFKRALEIDRDSALAHHHYAHFLSNIGRNQEAIAEAEETRRLDPTNPFFITIQGLVYKQAGRYDEAFARFDEATKLNGLWLARLFAAIAYTDLGRYQEALEAARQATESNSSQSISTAYESVALAGLGRRVEAKKILKQLLARSRAVYVPPYHLAIAYVGLGDREHALEQLEKSFSEQDVKIVFLKTDHIWDPIRSEPRFVELMT
jgi:serine/threonine-protein kinase